MNLIAKNRWVFNPVFVVMAILTAGFNVRGQDSDEVKRLKERNELLETKLKLAELQIENLKKDIEDLKAHKPSTEKEGTKKSLSDLLTEGKVLSGTVQSTKGNRVGGEMTLTITSRDKRKIKGDVHVVLKGEPMPFDYTVEGEILGTQLTLTSTGIALKATFTLTHKSDSLEGKYSVSDGNKGTVGLKIPK
jgi:hypothetical protein